MKGTNGATHTNDDKLTPIAQVYVFLSSLALPYFGRENWRSTIRHLAAAHPRYSDLTSWDGRETTDFVYDDVRGVFTALLISKGHLSGSQWEGKAPRYYIEVKASLDRRETPFHVSQDQAERVSPKSERRSPCPFCLHSFSQFRC